MLIPRLRKIFPVPLFLIFFALVASACSVQYVSRYDATTEQSITIIQRQLEIILNDLERNLGKPEAEYEHYAEAYKKISVNAKLLSTRAQAIDNNEITIKQSQVLMGFINNLETLHKSGISSSGVVSVLHQQVDQIMVAMLKFELAKKRQFNRAHTGESKEK